MLQTPSKCLWTSQKPTPKKHQNDVFWPFLTPYFSSAPPFFIGKRSVGLAWQSPLTSSGGRNAKDHCCPKVSNKIEIISKIGLTKHKNTSKEQKQETIINIPLKKKLIKHPSCIFKTSHVRLFDWAKWPWPRHLPWASWGRPLCWYLSGPKGFQRIWKPSDEAHIRMKGEPTCKLPTLA